MSSDVEIEEPLDELDPIEDAWLQQEPETVEAMAREALVESPDDGLMHSWLGLALALNGKSGQSQSELKRAFELIRQQEVDATEPDDKHLFAWELHGIANRLIDALADNPTLAVPAASFVVQELKLDHAPSLRLLSEDVAVREGDPVRAAGLLKRALAIDPQDPESHYLAARLFARMGKKPNVISHLTKSLDNASGTIAVRTLARFEPDFDGFRKDAEFNALIDLFPTDEALRPIYVALDAGDFDAVLQLCEEALEGAANRLDILYPYREAVELLLDQSERPEGDADSQLGERLDALQAEIEEREDKEEESAAYARFCGDA